MPSSLKDLIRDWKEWVPPLAAGTLIPWQDKLTSLEVLPNYYQPSAGIAATFLAGLSVLATYALSYRTAKANLKRYLRGALVVLVLCIAGIGILSATLGETWHPIGGTMIAARSFWVAAYIIGAISIAQVVLLSLLIRRSNRPKTGG